MLVYVGAVCVAQAQGGNTQSNTPLTSELVAPLFFNANTAMYQNQSSGGTAGLNNASVVNGYR